VSAPHAVVTIPPALIPDIAFDPVLPDPADATQQVDRDVPDPYYGGEEGFAEVVAMVERTCRRLLQELEALDL